MSSERPRNPSPDAKALADLFASYGKEHVKEPSKFDKLSAPAKEAVKEKAELLRQYKSYLKEEKKQMLERGGRPLQSIVGFMEKAGPDDAAAIIEIFRQFIDTQPDPDMRQFVMRTVGQACARIREQCNLDPLDDPLPWDEDGNVVPGRTVFTRCRAMMEE